MTSRPLPPLDPRHWNLALGAALALGCGPEQPSADDGHSTTDPGESSTNDSGETSTSDATSDTTTGLDDDPPECVNSSDCGPGYECVGGVCEYYGYDDGHPWFECYSDLDCEQYMYCLEYFCAELAQPPPACDVQALIPRLLETGATPLGLTFVDVDADGRDELAVATQDAFLIYTPDSNLPTALPRVVPSSNGELLGGQFDQAAGEDLIVNELEGGLVLYSADGNGAFTNPGAMIPGTDAAIVNAMIAGDIDGQAPEDLVVTSNEGAIILLGAETPQLLSVQSIAQPVLLDRSHSVTGIAAARQDWFEAFDLDGFSVGVLDAMSGSLAAVHLDSSALYFVVRDMAGWGWVYTFDPTSGAPGAEYALPQGSPEMRAADLDGDQFDEVLLRYPSGTTQLWLGAPEGCLLELDLQVAGNHEGRAAVGDHDGDGDEELALRLDSGAILILDHE